MDPVLLLSRIIRFTLICALNCCRWPQRVRVLC